MDKQWGDHSFDFCIVYSNKMVKLYRLKADWFLFEKQNSIKAIMVNCGMSGNYCKLCAD